MEMLHFAVCFAIRMKAWLEGFKPLLRATWPHMTHIVRECCALHPPISRSIHAGCASHSRIRRKCCAHLPREGARNKGCYFWTPLYILFPRWLVPPIGPTSIALHWKGELGFLWLWNLSSDKIIPTMIIFGKTASKIGRPLDTHPRVSLFISRYEH
jgi:hypothetical protein